MERMYRLYLVLVAGCLILIGGGCALVNEVKDSNRQYDEKQKEKKANPQEKSLLPPSMADYNDTEKQELEAFYKHTDQERKAIKKQVYGGFMP